MSEKVQIRVGERVNRSFPVEIGQADAELPVIEFTVSDETVDRYGEVVSAAGWDLANYRKNPVFLNCHQSNDIIHVLGIGEDTDVRGTNLWQRTRFAVEANPVARLALNLYRGRFLRAVSVGFVPKRWEDGDDGQPWTRRFVSQELLEVSAVPIPANPSALALALKSGAVASGTVDDSIAMLETLRATRNLLVQGKSEQPIGPVRAPADDALCARLLNVLKEITTMVRGGK